MDFGLEPMWDAEKCDAYCMSQPDFWELDAMSRSHLYVQDASQTDLASATQGW